MKNKDLLYKENNNGNIIDLFSISKKVKNKKNEITILEDINLSIKKGSFTVIIGKSGSGKTTLMNIMSGMTLISSGEAIISNSNLSKFKNSDLINFRRENISFIFQDYGLLSTLNVMDNIKSGIYLSNDKLPKSKIQKIINYLELNNYLKSMPNELSGGQQQRVSIARALVKNPKIIFGDEPTGSLDSYNSFKVLKILKEINNDGTTIVLVTHDSRVAKIADHIIEIENGKVIKNIKNKPIKNFEILFV